MRQPALPLSKPLNRLTLGFLFALAGGCSTAQTDQIESRLSAGESYHVLPAKQWHIAPTPDGTDILVCEGEFQRIVAGGPAVVCLRGTEQARFWQLHSWARSSQPGKWVTGYEQGLNEELIVYFAQLNEPGPDFDEGYLGGLPNGAAFTGIGPVTAAAVQPSN